METFIQQKTTFFHKNNKQIYKQINPSFGLFVHCYIDCSTNRPSFVTGLSITLVFVLICIDLTMPDLSGKDLIILSIIQEFCGAVASAIQTISPVYIQG